MTPKFHAGLDFDTPGPSNHQQLSKNTKFRNVQNNSDVCVYKNPKSILDSGAVQGGQLTDAKPDFSEMHRMRNLNFPFSKVAPMALGPDSNCNP